MSKHTTPPPRLPYDAPIIDRVVNAAYEVRAALNAARDLTERGIGNPEAVKEQWQEAEFYLRDVLMAHQCLVVEKCEPVAILTLRGVA